MQGAAIPQEQQRRCPLQAAGCVEIPQQGTGMDGDASSTLGDDSAHLRWELSSEDSCPSPLTGRRPGQLHYSWKHLGLVPEGKKITASQCSLSAQLQLQGSQHGAETKALPEQPPSAANWDLNTPTSTLREQVRGAGCVPGTSLLSVALMGRGTQISWEATAFLRAPLHGKGAMNE